MLWQLSPTCVLWCLEMQLCFHDACWKHLWVPLFCLLGLGAPHPLQSFEFEQRVQKWGCFKDPQV